MAQAAVVLRLVPVDALVVAGQDPERETSRSSMQLSFGELTRPRKTSAPGRSTNLIEIELLMAAGDAAGAASPASIAHRCP